MGFGKFAGLPVRAALEDEVTWNRETLVEDTPTTSADRPNPADKWIKSS